MAYEKHTWECGEAITTEKLNHIEEGIANAGGIKPYVIALDVSPKDATQSNMSSLGVTATVLKAIIEGNTLPSRSIGVVIEDTDGAFLDLVEVGDNYAIISRWDTNSNSMKYYRYDKNGSAQILRYPVTVS